MQLVVSPALEEGDVEALARGSEQRDELLRRVVARGISDIEQFIARETLEALAWLVANGSLQVKLALRESESGRPALGIYHEKLGIFSDADGNHVAFGGSANETSGGLVNNFENIDVFWSWDDPQGRVALKIADFEELWANQAPGVEVLDFTEVSRDLLRQYAPTARVADGIRKEASGQLRLTKSPRDYQQEAIDAWFANDCRGVLAMATGSGKTLTALHAVNRLAADGPLVVIIACPYINLAEQWVAELRAAGLEDVVRAYGTRSQWQGVLQARMSAMHFGRGDFLPVVVVNRTFLSGEFQSILSPDRLPHLLVADEMHNLGAEQLQRRLNPAFKYRLGLSATPERHLDAQGTSTLLEYFGGVVFTYDLARAIREKNLCEYYYHPVVVQLTDEEAVTYEELSVQISRMMVGRDPDEPGPAALDMLLLKRARLLASASGKLPALLEVVGNLHAEGRRVTRGLVYCGDGRVDDPEEDEGVARQIDAVIKALAFEADLKLGRFTHHESASERQRLLSDLKRDRLDALVAIRCLDEGIDLPDVRMGFILASSTNPRQFIQRRGRLLRKAAGKTRAEIWDFIVSPPDLSDCAEASTFNLERRLVARELSRVVEFCQTAVNRDSAAATLLDLRRRYNLLANP